MTLTIELMGAFLILVGSLLPVGDRLRARALAEASLFAGFIALGTSVSGEALPTFVICVGVLGFAVIFVSETLSRVTLVETGPRFTFKTFFLRSGALLLAAIVFWGARMFREDDSASILPPAALEAIGAAAICAFAVFTTRFLRDRRRWR